MYLFQNIPPMLIKVYIFPYLDYNDRLATNLCLSRHDKIISQLDKEFGIKLQIRLATAKMKRLLEPCETLRPNPKSLLKLFKNIPLAKVIIHHNLAFRKVVIEKCVTFSDDKNPGYRDKSRYFKKTFVKICKAILSKIDTEYRYLYEVNTTNSAPAVQEKYEP